MYGCRISVSTESHSAECRFKRKWKDYKDAKKKHSKESEGSSFNASCGWFHLLKPRASLHNVKVSDEESSADLAAA